MLPSLCNLTLNRTTTVDSTLFEYLATQEKKGGKKSTCWYHSEEVGDTNYKENCAIEGYLMYKEVASLPEGSVNMRQMFGQDITVETPEGNRVMRALLNRLTSTKTRRLQELWNRHWDYLKFVFDKLCVRGYIQAIGKDGQPKLNKDKSPKMLPYGIEFTRFGEDLAKFTDWYFIDEWITKQEESDLEPKRNKPPLPPERVAEVERLKALPRHRGLLFVRLYDTTEVKVADDMPYEGVYKKPYLFVILVCATGSKGFGNYLMNMVYKLAYRLGCGTVALAALPEAAGFYYAKHGFTFASRDGDLIDIKDTPWHKETESGVRLVPDVDYNDPLEQQLREALQERIADDDARKKRNREILDEAGPSQDLQPDEVRQPRKRPNLLRYLASLFF